MLVLASTYPRWKRDPEPSFVHTLCTQLNQHYDIRVVSPHSYGARQKETLEGVSTCRFRYAPYKLETLVFDGGMLANLKRSPWKWLLVPFFMLGMIIATIRQVKVFQPHAIHCHWIVPQGFVLWVLSLFIRLPPIVITSHGADLFSLQGQIGRLLKRKAIHTASALTVVSKAMTEEAIQLGAEPNSLHVAPMGFGFAEASSLRNPPEGRASGRILFVGRLVEKKGLTHLLSIMPDVIAACPTAHLTIAGGGPERQALESQAKELGVIDRVQFLGPVPHEELPALYQSASVFCAPFVQAKSGDVEGLGLVTLEAISFRCPVLVGNVPAIQDVIPKDHQSWSVGDPKKHHQFSKALIQLLTQPPTREDLEDLKRHVETKFSWQHVGENYSQILNETIHSRQANGD